MNAPHTVVTVDDIPALSHKILTDLSGTKMGTLEHRLADRLACIAVEHGTQLLTSTDFAECYLCLERWPCKTYRTALGIAEGAS